MSIRDVPGVPACSHRDPLIREPFCLSAPIAGGADLGQRRVVPDPRIVRMVRLQLLEELQRLGVPPSRTTQPPSPWPHPGRSRLPGRGGQAPGPTPRRQPARSLSPPRTGARRPPRGAPPASCRTPRDGRRGWRRVPPGFPARRTMGAGDRGDLLLNPVHPILQGSEPGRAFGGRVVRLRCDRRPLHCVSLVHPGSQTATSEREDG